MADTLGERQAAILSAIVREYIQTGEPVGSKYLVERSGLNVSSATVRNEMARLEELGYLMQPHTSAGRVPTDLAYRFVVDQMTAPRQLAQGQQRQLANELVGDEPASIEELLRRASDVVSRFTHHAAAVLARRARPTRLRRLELLPVAERTAMAVLIADNGRVEQRTIPLDVPLSDERLRELAERLTAHLSGVLLEDAIGLLEQRATGAPPADRALYEGVEAAVRTLSDSEEHVVVGGAANLAGEEAFERETLHRLYEALERQTAVLELLASALDNRPISVRIGSEVPSEEFQRCSIVVATFGPEGTTGSVGVIGPTRMNYERVIATATTVARLLEQTIRTPERS